MVLVPRPIDLKNGWPLFTESNIPAQTLRKGEALVSVKCRALHPIPMRHDETLDLTTGVGVSRHAADRPFRNRAATGAIGQRD